MDEPGYASYKLTNNAANIRRIKQRIETLTRAASWETTREELAGGYTIVQNAEANRVQIFFPTKPSAEIRAKLNGLGFRWSPTEGAWQRHLCSSAVYWTRELLKGATS